MADVMLDPRAPMASAPIRFRPDGEVDWGNMWDTFCGLAQAGGPPHRGEMMLSHADADPTSEGYQRALHEIVRGIYEVSGLTAAPAENGWIAVTCHSAGMAHWLRDAILDENVQARAEGCQLWVPVGERYTLKGEIKSVITVVAKTTHYWDEHVPDEIKNTVEVEARLASWKKRLTGWFNQRPGPPKGG